MTRAQELTIRIGAYNDVLNMLSGSRWEHEELRGRIEHEQIILRAEIKRLAREAARNAPKRPEFDGWTGSAGLGLAE